MAQLLSTSVTGSSLVSGSFEVTGSVGLEVLSASFVGTTCSIDLSLGTFFVTTLTSTGATLNHFEILNPQKGGTANILVNSIAGSSASFSPNVVQPTISNYQPTDGDSRDVLTLVSFDENRVYVANVTTLE